MTPENVSPLYANPRYPGEYLATGHMKAIRVYRGAMKQGVYGWTLCSVFDGSATIAELAYKLSLHHIKQDFNTGNFLADQFHHLVTNLAVKLLQVMPFESRDFLIEKALQTVIRMSHLADRECCQLLVDARLEKHHPYAVEHQQLIRQLHGSLGYVPTAFIQAINGPDNADTYPRRVALALTQYPVAVPGLTNLSPAIIYLIKHELQSASQLSDEQRFLLEWMDSTSAADSEMTNAASLQGEALNPSEVLSEFTLEVITATYTHDCDQTAGLRVSKRVITTGQGGVADHLISGEIAGGRWETQNGKLVAMFRSSRTVPCKSTNNSTLTSFALLKINGHEPDTNTINLFCHLFYLSFDYEPSTVALDGAL